MVANTVERISGFGGTKDYSITKLQGKNFPKLYCVIGKGNGEVYRTYKSLYPAERRCYYLQYGNLVEYYKDTGYNIPYWMIKLAPNLLKAKCECGGDIGYVPRHLECDTCGYKVRNWYEETS